MAPKKDEGIFASFKDEDQYYEDFEQKLYDGFHAQKTDLDKLSYIMELSAMASDLAIIRARLMKVPSEVDRDDYKNEEEYQQALEREKERNKIEFFSEEEKAELGFSDREQAGKLQNIVRDAMNDCYRQYKENRKESDEALLKSIDVYSRDKEKVRFSSDGVARFDNAMDALSIMKDNIPGIGEVIDTRVSAINKTRKAESVDHKDHLDLTKYGAERAQAENAKRTGQPAEEKEQVKDEDGPVLS